MNNNGVKRSCVRSFVDQKTINTLRNELTEKHELTSQAEILGLLGSQTRLEILYCLSKAEELCVCDLADILDKEVSTISHQLRRLKDRGFIKNRRDGLTIYYRLSLDEKCQEAFNLIESIFVSELEIENNII